MRNLRARSRALSACGIAAAVLGSQAAQAVDITGINASITAGKLLITGTTDTPNANVRLEGQAAATFNTTSNGSRAFTFNFVYHPGDCTVSALCIKSTKRGEVIQIRMRGPGGT